jgi:hypothetical protein
MNYNNSSENRKNNKQNGFSVRCLRDLEENKTMQVIILHGLFFIT